MRESRRRGVGRNDEKVFPCSRRCVLSLLKRRTHPLIPFSRLVPRLVSCRLVLASRSFYPVVCLFVSSLVSFLISFSLLVPSSRIASRIVSSRLIPSSRLASRVLFVRHRGMLVALCCAVSCGSARIVSSGRGAEPLAFVSWRGVVLGLILRLCRPRARLVHRLVRRLVLRCPAGWVAWRA